MPPKAGTSVQYLLFPTGFGHMGFAWTAAGLKTVLFPTESEKEILRSMLKRHPSAVEAAKVPSWAKELRRFLVSHLSSGKSAGLKSKIDATLPDVPFDFTSVPEFHQRVYREALKLKPGQTLSYGELAARAGSPGAARAVGQAMARNPIPLVVPCHRVLASGRKIGGFTAPGGLVSKAKILEHEGFCLAPRVFARNFDASTAIAQLAERDPKMGRLIQEVGPFTLKPRTEGTPFHWLLRSIIYQQLHGKAAATIHGRVKSIFGGRDPEPEELLKAKESDLIAAGLSRNKRLAVLDLARAAMRGEVPDRKRMSKMSDEEIIETLTRVRGIGRWTVEMLLIFNLGRADVMALDDFALRKSAMMLHKKKELSRSEFEVLSGRWKPWRTVASWYLWRALDPKPTPT